MKKKGLNASVPKGCARNRRSAKRKRNCARSRQGCSNGTRNRARNRRSANKPNESGPSRRYHIHKLFDR